MAWGERGERSEVGRAWKPVLRKSRRSVVPELEDLLLVPTLRVQGLGKDQRSTRWRERTRRGERDPDLHTSILWPLTSDPPVTGGSEEWIPYRSTTGWRDRGPGWHYRCTTGWRVRWHRKFSFSPERSELSSFLGSYQQPTTSNVQRFLQSTFPLFFNNPSGVTPPTLG
jgi:hypothetical protein